MKKILIAWVLLFAIVLGLAGCGNGGETMLSTAPTTSENLVALELLSAMIRQSVEEKAADDKLSASTGDFALSLLQNSYTESENTVLSPYSVYLALAMTANGAKGQTLAQIESLLGMSVEEVNPYILSLQNSAGSQLSEANSIWVHRDLTVEESYLQTLKNYYEIQAYSADFDASTLETMNNWIQEQTGGRIPQALDRMDPNAMLYLINALTFDGNWEIPYTTGDITNQTFYGADGEKIVEMMGSTEHFYLHDDRATGFMKDYEGGQYSFFALLPNEGISLGDYLSGLNSNALLRTIEGAESTSVIATMPKLSLETTVEMKDILMGMGMTDAFTMDADLSGINGQQDLYIHRVLHKTYLQVDEVGTQAGAVTIEEFVTKGVAIQSNFVFLNRPYLMGIYDKTTQTFLFLGTVENP